MTWAERYSGVVMNTYGTPQATLVRGEGRHVWDDSGKRYLDFLAGIAVNALGHAHPAVVESVSQQLGTLGHISNFFASPAQIELAEELIEVSGMSRDARVFFCNSGAEANEVALKLTRRTGRHQVIALEGGFHGRTMGALSLTHKPTYREPFEPLIPGVQHVPFNDLATLQASLGDGTAAFFAEPIQGEAGVRVPDAGYLAASADAVREAGGLVVWDEVQSGMGRTGAWFAYQHAELAAEPVIPDVLTLAKGLGGGLPIGAVLADGPAATMLVPGNHGSTFGGNPVSAAAALATIRTIRAENLMANSERQGKRIRDAVLAWQSPHVATVRGQGLLLAVQLTSENAPALMTACREGGVILNAVAPDAIRLAPPLNVTDAEVEEFLGIFQNCLSDLDG